jgi:hypothetical protein
MYEPASMFIESEDSFKSYVMLILIDNVNIVRLNVFWTGPSRPKSSPAHIAEDSLDMLVGRGCAPRQPHL